jgi:rod shape determining protein RodA
MIILVLTNVFGAEARGSARWLNLGFANLQGAELAKPVLTLTLASFFARYSPASFKNFFLSVFIATFPVLLIIQQPNLSNGFILASTWVFMVFVAGANLSYLAVCAGSFLLAVPIIWNLLLRSYQQARIIAFFNPNLDPQGAGYNVVQALIALGSGQLIGKGLGRGTQSHLDFLPEGRTDFILAAAGEELGFIGVSLIIIIFAFLIYRILVSAKEIKDIQGSLFAYGAAFTIGLQFFINAGMNMGILPVSGVTLPFVSFGGSSMVSMFILLGLVQAAKKGSQGV